MVLARPGASVVGKETFSRGREENVGLALFVFEVTNIYPNSEALLPSPGGNNDYCSMLKKIVEYMCC